MPFIKSYFQVGCYNLFPSGNERYFIWGYVLKITNIRTC